MGGESCTVLRLRLMHKLAMSHTNYFKVCILYDLEYNVHCTDFAKYGVKYTVLYSIVFTMVYHVYCIVYITIHRHYNCWLTWHLI